MLTQCGTYGSELAGLRQFTTLVEARLLSSVDAGSGRQDNITFCSPWLLGSRVDEIVGKNIGSYVNTYECIVS